MPKGGTKMSWDHLISANQLPRFDFHFDGKSFPLA
jgi:hypothetical protein